MVSNHLSAYKSAFDNWEKQSAVRAKPNRFVEGKYGGEYFFSPELVPICEHAHVQSRDPQVRKNLIIRHLYTHLTFTEHLEHEIVNQMTFKIGKNQLGLELPISMRMDAWKIYVDEAYHFKFSADLLHKVQALTRIQITENQKPQFLNHLQNVLTDQSQQTKALIRLFFTIVSETLISGTLLKVPHDQRVVPIVREIIKDHAEDEVKHHAYFASLLKEVWPQLSAHQQKEMGLLLPDLIFGFLTPDLGALNHDLLAEGFSEKECAEMIEDTYRKNRVDEEIRRAAKVTINHFYQSDVMKNPYILEAFMQSGLIKA
ncbi:diiron oxygenase [Hazenella sp. IB182353]|uniref:diiron oxygenase n=1 Tax=Polycladospora coralii TaxID=2771432 RepID=UPI0017460DA6|nr:diiron oxygenase [Polycladospora coralii]MBS7532007.1 diiron oxygenase [Polycladospora coralii]